MSLFKKEDAITEKKPSIQVLKVKTEKRDVKIEEHSSFGHGGFLNKDKTIKKCSYTIVLMVKDGELCTREFNGDWNLTDIKKWEDL